MYLFTYFVRLNKFYIKIIKWERTIVKCLILFSVFILYLMIKFKLEDKMVVRAYFISAVTACIAIIIALKWQSDRYKMEQKSMELKMHEIYGKTFEGMLENIRIRQHDYKNQLAAIYGMHLTADSFEELVESQKQYCDNLVREGRYDSILTSCNDKILAGFLYTKFAECEKVGMEINFEVFVNNS